MRGDRSAIDGIERTIDRRTFLRATGAGVAGVTTGGLVGTAGAVGGSTPPLHTEGRWIRDPAGENVELRGFATAGLDFIANDWYPFSTTEVLERATDGEQWQPNAIRLPVTEWPFIEQGPAYVVEELLRPAVDVLADRGVYAMIDFHLIRPYVETRANAEGMVADGWAETIDDLGFDASVPTDELLMDFWSAVAPAFADDDHVLYELFNEPTLPVAWSSYGSSDVSNRQESWTLWQKTAQPWVDEIRAHAPETPIIVGSPSWTSRTDFAPEYPFEGDNLVYAGHIYPPNGQPSEFDSVYGAPAEDVPVAITEFGWDPSLPEDDEGYGTTSGWGEPFREWVDSYDNVGWFGWCFDHSWAPTFFEETGDSSQPWALKDGPEEHGGFIRQWLADAASGGDSPPEPPILGDARPTDPDGDGVFEDVSGNGDLDFPDVNTLFQNTDAPAVQNTPTMFDFDGDGDVDSQDVLALFERI
ncbi:cellulase family glycosylhydrolase [Halococcoides cellulosivorans]|uniref:Glycoside hydrolase family 5 domain-containing protein n=1 Tax=Halococcoides cellulosivorans TaxID=1679096 RepID=A0A2R4X367_9EURY|nr:cellulase family glycosylhydrolase [Halococcoides cellulosivorans]AWB28232.1 hypothetical protein HARCEL1_11220 [Halococcoides cellulosivorans]